MFQTLVNDVLRELLNRFVFVHLDDILIFLRSRAKHVNHVRMMLQQLLQHSLFVKVKKFYFHASLVPVLGYVIGQGLDPAKG